MIRPPIDEMLVDKKNVPLLSEIKNLLCLRLPGPITLHGEIELLAIVKRPKFMPRVQLVSWHPLQQNRTREQCLSSTE